MDELPVSRVDPGKSKLLPTVKRTDPHTDPLFDKHIHGSHAFQQVESDPCIVNLRGTW
jgi:hypothetical protein